MQTMLVALALVARKSPRWLPRLLATMAVAAVVLGFVGWGQLDRQDATISLSLATRAYGTVSLFQYAATDVQDVPFALQVARILAPLTLAGAILGVAVRASHEFLNGWVGRRLRGHVVLVGPAARVVRFAPPEANGARHPATLHADPVDGAALVGCVAVRLGEVPPPLEDLSARRASRIVVSMDDDADSMVMLAGIWDLLGELDGLEATVDLRDPQSAFDAAVLAARSDPGRHLDITCSGAVVAELAARAVVEASGADQQFVLVGAGPSFAALAKHVVSQLGARNEPDGVRSRVAVVGPSNSDRFVEDLRNFATLDLHAYDSPDAVIDATYGPAVVVVDHGTEARSLQAAVAILVQRPAWPVYVRSDAPSLPMGLRPLDVGPTNAEEVVGLWLRAARSHLGDTAWAEAGRRAQLEEAHRMRAAVAAILAVTGWELRPLGQIDHPVVTVPRKVLAAAGLTDPGLVDLAHDLATAEAGFERVSPVDGERITAR